MLLMTKVLVGSGGHATVVHEIASQQGLHLDGFIDPIVIFFNQLKKMEESDNFTHFFVGIGGVTNKQLLYRHSLFIKYKKTYQSFSIISPKSYLSKSAKVGDGTLLAHQSIVQANSIIGENCIINTNSIIEHDVIIEDGCHIAPGAIILGGAQIGSCSMIGAGAVILPNQIIPSETLVPALTRYPISRHIMYKLDN
jgi:acetyltransferase EpsM